MPNQPEKQEIAISYDKISTNGHLRIFSLQTPYQISTSRIFLKSVLLILEPFFVVRQLFSHTSIFKKGLKDISLFLSEISTWGLLKCKRGLLFLVY